MKVISDDKTLALLTDDELTVILQALGDYKGPYGRSPEETTLNPTEIEYHNKYMKLAETIADEIYDILWEHAREAEWERARQNI